MKRCYAQGPACDGPIEGHHIVKKQRIRRAWKTLNAKYLRDGPKPWSLRKALEDPRNIVFACKRTHHVEESPVPLPDGFWNFIEEYNLWACLPRFAMALAPEVEDAA